MGADQPRWYQIGKRHLQHKDRDGRTDPYQTVENPRAPNPTPTTHKRSAADRHGAIVARSQILVSGSTATPLGTMTNETGCDVHFSGVPPYAITFDTDGSQPVLLGDFPPHRGNNRPPETG